MSRPLRPATPNSAMTDLPVFSFFKVRRCKVEAGGAELGNGAS